MIILHRLMASRQSCRRELRKVTPKKHEIKKGKSIFFSFFSRRRLKTREKLVGRGKCWENSTGYSLLGLISRMTFDYGHASTLKLVMCMQMRNRLPWIPAILIKLLEPRKFRNFQYYWRFFVWNSTFRKTCDSELFKTAQKRFLNNLKKKYCLWTSAFGFRLFSRHWERHVCISSH